MMPLTKTTPKTTHSSKYAIVVEDLKKSFGKFHALNGLDFHAKQGEVVALLGPNGSGKTTTVRILSTLLKADSGRVEVNGFDPKTHPNEVRNSIGLTGQYAAVDEYLTGEENLLMIGRLSRLSYALTRTRAKELLQRFDLVDASKRPAKTYSGGMKRRLDIAMSLIASPRIIFLDEPTTGLDPRSRLGVWDLVKQLAASGVTILLTTQYMEEADQLADRMVIIDKGKVIAEGTADQLKARVGADRVEVVISPESDFDTAVKAVDGHSARVNAKERTISVPTREGAKDLKQILDRLEKKHIDVENVSLHRPTLDDVFLSLTGHVATAQKEEENPGARAK